MQKVCMQFVKHPCPLPPSSESVCVEQTVMVCDRTCVCFQEDECEAESVRSVFVLCVFVWEEKDLAGLKGGSDI